MIQITSGLFSKKKIIMFLLLFSPGELFAQAPVEEYPGIAVETVSDSSRYFVLRIQDDNGGWTVCC